MSIQQRILRTTPGGLVGFLAVVALAGVALFLAAARWVNTAPSQCATCHPELTAMWDRSGGHPADRVSCYECHAQHAELPGSLNVLAYGRDRLIPEKYASGEERIEGRCEGCHAGIRNADQEVKKLIRVNHKVHLAPLQGLSEPLGCLDCHRNVAHDKAQVETNRPAMSGCFAGECHQKDSNKDNCRRCHYQHLAEPGAQVL